MSRLFVPTSLAKIRLKNRFVRSATWEGLAGRDGACTAELVAVISALAEGEVGLIISSHAYVRPEGQAGPRQIAICDDRFVEGYRAMTDAAHGGGSAIVMQLAHAGIQAPRSLTTSAAVGPSAVRNHGGVVGLEMTIREIESVIEAFVQGARRAREAGCDGVQIHAAHGYLLSQFLSPHYNHRADAFGGTVAKRARIVVEILQRIKSLLGTSFPVLIKMNSDDFLDDGLTTSQMLDVADLLQESGIDAIELSGGVNDPACHYSPAREGTPVNEEEEVYYRQAAVRYKRTIQVPLILVGGIRSCEVADELLATGIADYVSLSRPLIREPALIARWKAGDLRPSACGSCNGCFTPIREGKGMYCVSQATTH